MRTKTLADVWSSNIAEEEILREEPRFFFGKSKDIGILMSSRDGSSALRATIQAYQSQDDTEESPRKAAFPREKVPSHRELQKWAEGQIQRESSSHFKHSLQNFLYAYADEGRGLPKVCLTRETRPTSPINQTPARPCQQSS
jgi:hypothetical protein